MTVDQVSTWHFHFIRLKICFKHENLCKFCAYREWEWRNFAIFIKWGWAKTWPGPKPAKFRHEQAIWIESTHIKDNLKVCHYHVLLHTFEIISFFQQWYSTTNRMYCFKVTHMYWISNFVNFSKIPANIGLLRLYYAVWSNLKEISWP